MARRDRDLDNIWIIVPLAGISIPLVAILRDAAWFPWLFIGLVMTAAVTFAVRSVLGYRHRLRMEEIAARERTLHREQEHLRSAERILELDDTRDVGHLLNPPMEA